MFRFIYWNLILSTIVITFFCYDLNLTIKVLPLHLSILIYPLLILNFCFFFTIKTFNNWVNKISISLITTSYCLFIILVYSSYYIGISTWGSTLNIYLIYSFYDELEELIHSTTYINYDKLVFYILVISCNLFLINYFLAQKIISSINGIKISNLISKKNIFVLSIIIIYPILIKISYNLKFDLKKSEPFISFFFNEFIPQNKEKLFSGVENKVAKEKYPVIDNFNKKNVILIIVDALRSDKINNSEYERKLSPFLDSLTKLENVHHVKNYYSTSSSSFQGISSILSSSYKISLNNFFLHDLLKKQGYHINFILSGDHTNWYSLKDYYGENIDFFVDGYLSKKSNQVKNANNDKLIIKELNEISDYNNEPKFFYLHMMSTHESSTLEEKYKIYKPDDYNVFSDNISPQSLTNNYDNRIIQLDNYLKEIIRILENKNYLENSILVITSDHGQSLGEKGYYFHTNSTYLSEVSIPLIIFSSESKSMNKKNEHKISNQLDVSPTIIDMLGIEIPYVWDGSSLLRPQTNDFLFIQEKEFFSCIWLHEDESYQYIFNNFTKKEEVYNIDLDIELKTNVLNEKNNLPINYIRSRMKDHFFEISNKSIPN